MESGKTHTMHEFMEDRKKKKRGLRHAMMEE